MSEIHKWGKYSTFPTEIVIEISETITVNRQTLEYHSKSSNLKHNGQCEVYLLEKFVNKIREITESFQDEYDSLKKDNKI